MTDRCVADIRGIEVSRNSCRPDDDASNFDGRGGVSVSAGTRSVNDDRRRVRFGDVVVGHCRIAVCGVVYSFFFFLVSVLPSESAIVVVNLYADRHCGAAPRGVARI